MATKEENNAWWERLLGFVPEQTFQPSSTNYTCYKCGCKQVESLPAGSWTAKWRCLNDDCGYFNYVVHADFMSGALHEDVAIDKKDVPFN